MLGVTLRANAVFSLLCATVLVVGAVPLASWMGVGTWVAVAVGLGLLPFGLIVFRVARDPAAAGVRQIIAADVGWVAAAVVILVAFPDAMSTVGRWLLALVSLVVAEFAAGQYVGLKRAEARS